MTIKTIFLCSIVALFCTQCNQNPVEPALVPVFDSEDLRRPPAVDDGSVKALVVYSQDADDDYPFPSDKLRERMYLRLSQYFDVMSYGKHELVFEEITDGGDYFKAQYTSDVYKSKFANEDFADGDFDGPYAIYNKEILEQVVQKQGEVVFENIDLLIMVATDGGPGWYVQSINGQGFARLGFEWRVADKQFTSEYGGITLEIGSDFSSQLYDEVMLYWLFAHEYTHYLGYRRHRQKNLGIYSLMTTELWTNETMRGLACGPNPLDPFLLMRFGWLDRHDTTRVLPVRVNNGSVRITLNQIRSHTGPVLARIPLPGTENPALSHEGNVENFYVAFHRRDANPFDACYVASGLLVWHAVNESILDIEAGQSQSGKTNHDHLDEGEHLGGLPEDFYNSGNRLEFRPDTNPNTNIWGIYHPELKNHPTGISITDIHEDGDQISFTVSFRE